MQEEMLSHQVTKVLMDNGCAVTNVGVEAIVQYIADRDKRLLEQYMRYGDKILQNLKWTYGTTRE